MNLEQGRRKQLHATATTNQPAQRFKYTDKQAKQDNKGAW